MRQPFSILKRFGAFVLAPIALSLAACNQTPAPTQTPTPADTAPQFSKGDLIDPEGSAQALRQPNWLLTLSPGNFRTIRQRMPVNIVFLGFDRGDGAREINEGKVRSGLPNRYETLNRDALAYKDKNGNPIKEPVGVAFNYRYNLQFAPKHFEDAFFGYLSSIALNKPLTLFQTAYNCQFVPDTTNPPCTKPAANVSKPVTSNAWIDAPSVEKWLAQHAGGIGVNTRAPTVFLINWYSRPDFKFHVFTKTDEPDPDTGYNFGELRNSRKMMAWGGTSASDLQGGLGSLHRIWFYDLSAGPESNTYGWDMTNPDADGDGTPDYRMPPIWEYGSDKATYRKFNDLSGDLGKIVRNVAINLLFTTSPIYRPAITPPTLPDRIKLNVSVYQGLSGTDGKSLFTPSLLTKNVSELQPLNDFHLEIKDRAYTAEAKRAYECLAGNTTCYPDKLNGEPFASLFIYNLSILPNVLTGAKDYEIPIFAYTVDDTIPIPFLGLADDDWKTATQSFVYGVDSPAAVNLGYGFTTTFIHEVGHHLALSHPHDGYDFETDTDYGPGGKYLYAWAGDQSNSMMSYIDLNWNFSQFDLDNMNRYLVATYINQSNAVLKKVYDAKKAGKVAGAIIAADVTSTIALYAYWNMQYDQAVTLAKAGYEAISKTAQAAGIDLEPFVWYKDYTFDAPAASLAARHYAERQNEAREFAHRNMP